MKGSRKYKLPWYAFVISILPLIDFIMENRISSLIYAGLLCTLSFIITNSNKFHPRFIGTLLFPISTLALFQLLISFKEQKIFLLLAYLAMLLYSILLILNKHNEFIKQIKSKKIYFALFAFVLLGILCYTLLTDGQPDFIEIGIIIAASLLFLAIIFPEKR